ncbi:transposase, MuDR, MULE transposase domain protein [Tanacetum coccineum]
MVESSIIEQDSSKFKLKLRYRGFFRLVKNSNRRKYCFGSQKCIYMDACSFDLNQLNEEVLRHYPSHIDQVFSIVFVDKYVTGQSFIELNSDENFMAMLNMYEQEKEITIYVSTDKNLGTHNTQQRYLSLLFIEEPIGDGDSDRCSSDESYFSHLSSDDDDGDVNEISNYDYSNTKKSPTMEVSSKFPNVVAFRRALNHHAVINEYDYFIEKSDLERFTARCTQQECPWRIHASVKQDDITFEHERLLKEIASVNEDAVKYLTINHNKLWSRTFRYQPVLDLLDNIREKILKRLDKKRRIVRKWNGTLVPMAKSYLKSISKASKLSYGVATMPGKDQWVRLETGEKIYPKKGTDVSNVVNLDTVKSHAKIH